MRTITVSVKCFFAVLLLSGSQAVFAGGAAGNTEQKYRIKIVKEENGIKQITDKTFESKAEMETFAKENNLDLPAEAPLTEPAKLCMGKPEGGDAKGKKISIGEISGNGADGTSSLTITYQNFTAVERAALIQNIMNEKKEGVAIEITK